MPDPKWASEADMMATFQAEARTWGFRVYPESGGHDLLLQATEATLEQLAGEHRDLAHPQSRPHASHPFRAFHGELEVGDVLVVEGKLRASFEVLSQAMPRGRLAREWVADESRAADWYVVVVPSAPVGFTTVAEACGVVVVECLPERPGRYGYGREPAGVVRVSTVDGALRVAGYKRIQVPRIEVEMAAGQPAPRAVTTWKIGAVELCLLAQHRPLTRSDFKCRRVTPDSMARSGWIECTGRGKAATWTLTGRGLERVEPDADGRLFHRPRRPDIEYPEIVEALRRSGFDPTSPAPDVAAPDAVNRELALFRSDAT